MRWAANNRMDELVIPRKPIEVLAFVAVAVLAPACAHADTVKIDPGAIVSLEKSVGAAQRRNIFCTLGYNNCYTALTELSRRPLPKQFRETVIIVPPYTMTSPIDGVSLVTFQEIRELPEGTPDGTEALEPPSWSALTERDRELYDDVWKDGELNVTYFLGYRDLGVNRNAEEYADLFMYGVYALTLDKWRRFGLNWMMSFGRVDEFESVGEVSLGPDRLVRIRLVDPHKFCESDAAPVEKIEKDEITRSGKGLIVNYDGDGWMVRDPECDRQIVGASEVKARFLAALSDPRQDLLIYDGHSRFGAGPDFGMYARPEGKIAAEEFIDAVVASPARIMNLSSCSGLENYSALIEDAANNGKTVVWNVNSPDFLNGQDDVLLFIQGLMEGRSMVATENFMNVSHAVGDWANTVKVTPPSN